MIPHCSALLPPVCHRVSHLTGDYLVTEAREAGPKEINVSLNKHAGRFGEGVSLDKEAILGSHH